MNKKGIAPVIPFFIAAKDLTGNIEPWIWLFYFSSQKFSYPIDRIPMRLRNLLCMLCAG